MYEQFQNIMKMGPFGQIMVRCFICLFIDRKVGKQTQFVHEFVLFFSAGNPFLLSRIFCDKKLFCPTVLQIWSRFPLYGTAKQHLVNLPVSSLIWQQSTLHHIILYPVQGVLSAWFLYIPSLSNWIIIMSQFCARSVMVLVCCGLIHHTQVRVAKP